MMNIQTVAENLRNTIAVKQAALKIWRESDPIETLDRTHKAMIVGTLEINIDELKRILQDVEQCSPETFRS